MIRILLLIFSLFAVYELVAKEITVQAYGNTLEEAISNAKQIAITNLNGEFISNKKTWNSKEKSYSEDDYSLINGKINSYKVISYVNNTVTLLIDISDRDTQKDIYQNNSVEIDREDFDSLHKWFEEKLTVAESLNRIDDAIFVNIQNIDYSPGITNTQITLKSKFTWNKDWLNKTKEFLSVTNKNQYKNLDPEIFKRSFIQEIYKLNPIVAGLFSSILTNHKDEKEQSKKICFVANLSGLSMQCYRGYELFNQLPYYSEIPIQLNAYDDDSKIIFQKIIYVNQQNLYRHYMKNETAETYIKKIKFDWPAFMIKENEISLLNLKVEVNNDLAKKIDRFEISLNNKTII